MYMKNNNTAVEIMHERWFVPSSLKYAIGSIGREVSLLILVIQVNLFVNTIFKSYSISVFWRAGASVERPKILSMWMGASESVMRACINFSACSAPPIKSCCTQVYCLKTNGVNKMCGYTVEKALLGSFKLVPLLPRLP